MVKSYIKIYGPPLFEALRALEKIAVETPEVSYFVQTMQFTDIPYVREDLETYIDRLEDAVNIEVPSRRRGKLISKSGVTLGEYDFFFEWVVEPDLDKIDDLIKRIDEAMKPLGCMYTVTTK